MFGLTVFTYMFLNIGLLTGNEVLSISSYKYGK